MTRPVPTFIPDWTEYALLDTGGSKKFERFGQHTLIRPEPQAKWKPSLPQSQWETADAQFVKAKSGQRGEWKFRKPPPPRWAMQRKNLKFWVQPAPSGHVGVFPDQACHWDWLTEVITRAARPVKVLCLFGHTGLATLSAAAAGAEVTHVDASRQAVAWARENQALSGLSEHPIRWIVEDALTFVQREARRGHRYDAVMLDPPRFGRGPDGQLWKLADSLPELLVACATLLSPRPAFVLLNLYATVLTRSTIERDAQSLRSFVRTMLPITTAPKGRAGFLTGPPPIAAGELALTDAAHRQISTSIFARAEFNRL